jgi:hypothetical protein
MVVAFFPGIYLGHFNRNGNYLQLAVAEKSEAS